MTYLLDTMIVSYFLQAGRKDELARAAKRCSVALVEEVRRELEVDKKHGGSAFKTWLGSSNIAVRSLAVGGAAANTYSALRITKAGEGERASIALAASDKTLTFVTHDRKALLLALRELWMPGERILSLQVFLRRLFEQGALDNPDVLDEIISIPKTLLAQRPTWWASWRAAL